MKKVFVRVLTALLVVSLLISLTACGDGNASEPIGAIVDTSAESDIDSEWQRRYEALREEYERLQTEDVGLNIDVDARPVIQQERDIPEIESDPEYSYEVVEYNPLPITTDITIYWDSAGGTLNPELRNPSINISHILSQTWALPFVTKIGYEFDGWFLDEERVESMANAHALAIANRQTSITLTAHWREAHVAVRLYACLGCLVGGECGCGARIVDTNLRAATYNVSLNNQVWEFPAATLRAHTFQHWALLTNATNPITLEPMRIGDSNFQARNMDDIRQMQRTGRLPTNLEQVEFVAIWRTRVQIWFYHNTGVGNADTHVWTSEVFTNDEGLSHVLTELDLHLQDVNWEGHTRTAWTSNRQQIVTENTPTQPPLTYGSLLVPGLTVNQLYNNRDFHRDLRGDVVAIHVFAYWVRE